MNERFREAAAEFRAGRDRHPTPVAAEPVRFEFFPACDFADKPIPPRHWHVDGLVPGGTVTLLSGDGGTGKSLLALQLAVATASGGRWLGQDVAGGGALYLSAEDDRDELHRRLGDICVSAGARLADLDRLTLCPLAGEDALLAAQDRATGALRPTALFRDLDARLASERPALAVLDTLADMFPGNENDRTQARQFVGMLRGLAIRHECALLLLAHPSLSGLNTGSGTSGSTGWNNSVRSRIYLSRIVQDGYEADPDARVLRTLKSNYGPIGGEISLRWQNGVFGAQEPATELDRVAGNAKAERVFIKLLRLLADQGRRVNTGGGQTYAPTVFENHPEAEGVNKRAFRSAMESLLRNGAITIEEDGPPSKRRQYLEESQ
jgi:RecA-family ATPase